MNPVSSHLRARTSPAQLLAALAASVAIVVAGCSSYSSSDDPVVDSSPTYRATTKPASAGTPTTARPATRPGTPALPPLVNRSSPSTPSEAVPLVVVPGIAGEPDVRIRIAELASTVSISSQVKMVWVATSDSARAGRAPVRMSTPVAVTMTDAGWQLTDPAGLQARFPKTAVLQFAGEEGVIGAPITERRTVASDTAVPLTAGGSTAFSPSASVYVNGKRYGGIIEATTRSDSGPRVFDVIETVALEEYLKGVVSSEMYAGWPATTYRAQAVAARSYALHERARRRASKAPFDLEAGTRDQAYSGATVSPVVSRAVTDTRGVILSWAGTPLRAYYHSTCGGRAASARETWPSDSLNAFNLVGPLQAQPHDFACNSAQYFRWTVTRTRTDLTNRLRAFGREKRMPLANLSGIDSVREASVNAAGRPNRYLILQPGGQSYTISAEDFRSAANMTATGAPAVTSATRLPSGDFDTTNTAKGLTFAGRGFGHGVGLCQHCARGFAEKGENYQTILERFYPGARLERAY